MDVQLHVWKYAAIGGRVLDERGEPIAGFSWTRCIGCLQHTACCCGEQSQP